MSLPGSDAMSLPLNALVGLILSLKPSEPHTLAVLSIGEMPSSWEGIRMADRDVPNFCWLGRCYFRDSNFISNCQFDNRTVIRSLILSHHIMTEIPNNWDHINVCSMFQAVIEFGDQLH